MITRQGAERIAASVHAIRPDWPIASLITLITRDLVNWPVIEVHLGLHWVAIEQKPDGTWVSQTPARVKEAGPWRNLGLGTAARAERDRSKVEREAEARRQVVDACDLCDNQGYLPSGRVCDPHDDRYERAARDGAELGRQLLATAAVHRNRLSAREGVRP